MKSKLVAILLAFFLGGIGIHKFYLNRPIQGVIYLLLCCVIAPLLALTVILSPISFVIWCVMPILVIIDIVRYALMSDREFQIRYSIGRQDHHIIHEHHYHHYKEENSDQKKENNW